MTLTIGVYWEYERKLENRASVMICHLVGVQYSWYTVIINVEKFNYGGIVKIICKINVYFVTSLYIGIRVFCLRGLEKSSCQ